MFLTADSAFGRARSIKVRSFELVASSREKGSFWWPTRTVCRMGRPSIPTKTSFASASPPAKSYCILKGKRSYSVPERYRRARRISVPLSDGTAAEGDVLIGADGLHSHVRSHLWGDEPLRYAGCASLGGGVPAGSRPLRAINEARGMQVLLMTSDDFPAYSEAQLCDDLRLMFCAGTHVAVRQYHGIDDAFKPMLHDLDRWLMGIVTGQNLFDTSDVAFDRHN